MLQRIRRIRQREYHTDHDIAELPVSPRRLGKVTPEKFVPRRHGNKIEPPANGQGFPGVIWQIKYGVEQHFPDVPSHGEPAKDHACIKQIDDRRLDKQEQLRLKQDTCRTERPNQGG